MRRRYRGGRQPAVCHRRRTCDHCGGARPGPQARRLRPPRDAGHHRLAGRASRRPRHGRRRVGRGRAPLRHRPHPGRGQDRLARRPERPARPATTSTREGFAALLSRQGHQPRHDRRLLRRQLQLVGGLRPVGVQPVRPPRHPPARRRPAEVGRRRAGRSPPTSPPAPADRLPRGRAGRLDHPGLPRRGPRPRPRRAARWSTCARPRSTAASCSTCPTTRRRARCAAATSPARASVPWKRAANEDGTFKSADELRAIYDGEHGLGPTTTSSPTAASASAPATPGSCSPTCSATRRCATTTARGPSGATWCGRRSSAPASPAPTPG